MNRIDALFQRKREKDEKSLVLYLTGGFPDVKTTEKLLPVLEEAGCDLIELGVPFSDPIADGPTIQAASQSALQAGTTLKKLLEVVHRFRENSEVPLILFSAYNPFHKFGLEKLTAEAKSAGADGFLAGDLPVEESEEFRSICGENDMKLIYLVAPTSPPERKKLIASKASGFLYYVSLKGVTGARDKVAADLGRQVEELRKFSSLPVAVGFGVSKPEHVQAVSEHADAVVVGSALIDCVARNAGSRRLAAEVEKFVRSLSAPLRSLPV